jgi:3-methyladenine DNA glycosylase AlkD
MLEHILRDLTQRSNPDKAKHLSKYFKTGPGQYGEGDRFLGISVPDQRKIAKRYRNLPLPDLQTLLRSPIHEHRLTALLILVSQYEQSDHPGKATIFRFYLQNTEHINNWDLVDLSAPKIVGAHLDQKDPSLLFTLAQSNSVWERRIAILATFTFIKHNAFNAALQIAEQLVHDDHDLIHKAVGWMLREIGKRDQAIEEQFLRQHSLHMPRTMLRYAIEKFDDDTRHFYLNQRAS